MLTVEKIQEMGKFQELFPKICKVLIRRYIVENDLRTQYRNLGWDLTSYHIGSKRVFIDFEISYCGPNDKSIGTERKSFKLNPLLEEFCQASKSVIWSNKFIEASKYLESVKKECSNKVLSSINARTFFHQNSEKVFEDYVLVRFAINGKNTRIKMPHNTNVAEHLKLLTAFEDKCKKYAKEYFKKQNMWPNRIGVFSFMYGVKKVHIDYNWLKNKEWHHIRVNVLYEELYEIL